MSPRLLLSACCLIVVAVAAVFLLRPPADAWSSESEFVAHDPPLDLPQRPGTRGVFLSTLERPPTFELLGGSDFPFEDLEAGGCLPFQLTVYFDVAYGSGEITWTMSRSMDPLAEGIIRRCLDSWTHFTKGSLYGPGEFDISLSSGEKTIEIDLKNLVNRPNAPEPRKGIVVRTPYQNRVHPFWPAFMNRQ